MMTVKHRGFYASRTTLTVTAIGFILSMTACTGLQASTASSPVASTDDAVNGQPSREACAQSLPALQESAYGGQSGHMEALESLAACYERLGQNDKAELVHWRIEEDLNHPFPQDE